MMVHDGHFQNKMDDEQGYPCTMDIYGLENPIDSSPESTRQIVDAQFPVVLDPVQLLCPPGRKRGRKDSRLKKAERTSTGNRGIFQKHPKTRHTHK